MNNLPFTKTFVTGLVFLGVALFLLMIGAWFIAWIPGAVAALFIAKDILDHQ